MKYDLYRVASIIGGPGFRDDLNRLDSGKRLLEMANTYPDDCRIHDDCLIMRYFPYDVLSWQSQFLKLQYFHYLVLQI